MDPLLKQILESPPISTTIYYANFETVTLKKIIRAKWKIKSKFDDAEKDLGIVVEELKLLSQILYKNHNRFRNDKGYKDLRMLEKSLLKSLNHKFMKSLTAFLEFIPDSPSLQLKCYLPTQEMAEYTQLQLYGAAVFLERIEMLCKNCGLLDVQRLNLGHFWGVSAQNLAVVSRIWLVCRHLFLGVEIFYSGMNQIMTELPGEGSGVEMPADLYKFMPDELVEQVKHSEATVVDVKKGNEVKSVTVEDFLDIGEPIKRPAAVPVDAEANLQSLNRKRKKVVSHQEKDTNNTETSDGDSLAEIHSIEQMKLFLAAETESRKSNRKSSLTAKLKQDEWKALKKDVLANCIPTKPNKSLKLCRKLIRTAIK